MMAFAAAGISELHQQQAAHLLNGRVQQAQLLPAGLLIGHLQATWGDKNTPPPCQLKLETQRFHTDIAVGGGPVHMQQQIAVPHAVDGCSTSFCRPRCSSVSGHVQPHSPRPRRHGRHAPGSGGRPPHHACSTPAGLHTTTAHTTRLSCRPAIRVKAPLNRSCQALKNRSPNPSWTARPCKLSPRACWRSMH